MAVTRDAARWAWLFPAALLVHVAEEAWLAGGFPAWIGHASGVELSMGAFLAANVLGLVGMIAGAFFAARPGGGWALAALGAAVLTNALFHLVGTLVTQTFSPGLVTGLLLWVPLGAAALVSAARHARRRDLALGIAVGFVAHGVVTLAIALA